MPLILGTNSIKDTGYDVANSLRFDDGSSDYLNRTSASTGNRKTFTISYWGKRGNLTLGGTSTALSSGDFSTGDNHTYVGFQVSTDTARIQNTVGGSTVMSLISSALYRDVSAWYHFVWKVDTTQSTESNRVKLYVNGVEQTISGTYPAQNQDTFFGYADTYRVGVRFLAQSTYWDGYLAEVCYVDGTALDPTSFGEFDSDSPTIWKPIDVSGLTFGTNGFHLDFENASSLGADVSGNSNNFTVNNLTSVDQSTDTCTNNFATLNPLYKQNHAFSEGNLAYTSSASDWDTGLSTIGASSGKYYIETKITALGGGVTRTMFGLTDARNGNEVAENKFIVNYSNGDTIGYYNGSMYKNGASVSGSWSSYGINDILGMYVDLDNGKVYFSKNGSMQNSGDPTSGSTGTGAVSITTGQTYVFGVTNYGGGASQMNFGSPPFSISSGNSDPNGYGNFEYSTQNYYALNTKNLAEFG